MARKLTRKQSRYFGKRRSTRRAPRRSFRRTASRAYSRARRSYSKRPGIMRGWLPLSTSEMLVDASVGAFNPMIQSAIAPYVDQWLPLPDNFKDEARTAIVGSVLYKFGSGFIKDYGKETFRLAVMSTGGEIRNSFIGNVTLGASQDVYM